MGDWNLSRIADRLHQAAGDPTQWSDVLAELCRTIDAAGAVLVSTETRFAGLPFAPETGPMLDDYFKHDWSTQDVRYRGVPAMARKGFMVDDDFTSADERKTLPLYQELMARHGFQSFVAVGFMAGDDLWSISLQRNRAQGAFEPGDIRRLMTLWRPLADAAVLARQFGFARALGMTDGLEITNHAAMILDHRGRVIAANQAAERLVGGAMDICDGAVVLADRASQLRFDALIAAALTDKALPDPVPLATEIRDPALRRITVRAVTLRQWETFSFAAARVVLLFGAPTDSGPDVSERLRATYKLTAAETRLALSVASSGKSLAEIARDLGVSYETARVQLKAVFLKTGVHRQTALVGLVAEMAGKRLEP